MGIIRTWLNDYDFIDRPDRNEVIEEVAKEIEKFKAFGPDTIHSFSSYIRNMKSCPPCLGDCNQGRECPAKKK